MAEMILADISSILFSCSRPPNVSQPVKELWSRATDVKATTVQCAKWLPCWTTNNQRRGRGNQQSSYYIHLSHYKEASFVANTPVFEFSSQITYAQETHNMPLVVPDVTADERSSWATRLLGKKLGDKHDEVTFAKTDLPQKHRVLKPDSMATADFDENR